MDRKTGATRTVHVHRASVSIVGGIQPDVLRSAIGREHMKDGLCARLLLTMPEPKPVRWSEATVSSQTEAMLDKVFERLLALEPAADEEGRPAPFPIPLTPEAKKIWVEYFNRHRAEMAELEEDLAAAWSKLEAYAARFALIIHLCACTQGQANESAVDEAAMQAGIALADWFGNEARRVYAVLAETAEERHLRELAELISRKGGQITARELAHASRRYRSSGKAEAALEKLAEARLGSWNVEPTSGRPKIRFVLFENGGNGNIIGDLTEENEQTLPGSDFPNANGRSQDAVNGLLNEAAEENREDDIYLT
jgi:hypothetical protein